MILRNKRISRDANEVSLQISFSLPDVKRQLKMYYTLIGGNINTEQDLLYYFRHTLFLQFEDKHAEELSKWALKLSLRNNLIIQSVNDETRFYLADSLGGRGPGRPAKDDV